VNDKRSIDRIREAAGMMQVGAADDASAIKEAFTIGGVFTSSKRRGFTPANLQIKSTLQEQIQISQMFNSAYLPMAPIHLWSGKRY
jgi:hypothetical protein